MSTNEYHYEFVKKALQDTLASKRSLIEENYLLEALANLEKLFENVQNKETSEVSE